jgi:hypothetical protein
MSGSDRRNLEVSGRRASQVELWVGNGHDLAPRVALVAGKVGASGPGAGTQNADANPAPVYRSRLSDRSSLPIRRDGPECGR